MPSKLVLPAALGELGSEALGSRKLGCWAWVVEVAGVVDVREGSDVVPAGRHGVAEVGTWWSLVE